MFKLLNSKFCILSFVISFVIYNLSFIIAHPVHASYTESTYYIHTDNLGSVIAVSDDKGNNISQSKYSPYGSPNSSNPATERAYTGQIKDDKTTLSYYNARYYDPVLSRFVSADSVRQLADSPNRFAYVEGNPIIRNDPSGNWECAYGEEENCRKRNNTGQGIWVGKEAQESYPKFFERTGSKGAAITGKDALVSAAVILGSATLSSFKFWYNISSGRIGSKYTKQLCSSTTSRRTNKIFCKIM